MLRRLGHLLLSVTLLWFASANPWSGVRGIVPAGMPSGVVGGVPSGEPVSAAQIDAHDAQSRIATSMPGLATSRWAVMGPALPAAIVAAPELHAATVAARDVARTVVPLSAASVHARRERQLASIAATSTVHRLDALWRADAQRLLAIPQYAIAPPLIG